MRWLVLLLVLSGCSNGLERRHRVGDANAPLPTAMDIELIKERLRLARLAVLDVPAARRVEAEAAIDRAAQALARYERLAAKGHRRQQVSGLLYTAGVALVLDDTSGVGLLNDVRLPVIAVGILATHLATQAPAPPREIAQAWNDVIISLEAVGTTAEAIRTSWPRPPLDDCIENQNQCFHTKLQSVPGGLSGHSLCQDCYALCMQYGSWPDRTRAGKDCRWWLYR